MRKLKSHEEPRAREFVLAAIIGVGNKIQASSQVENASKVAVNYGLLAYLEFESRFEDTSETT